MVIHLWDKKSDYLLFSRHDRLVIGRGEIGSTITSSEESVTRSRSVSPTKGDMGVSLTKSDMSVSPNKSSAISTPSSTLTSNKSSGMNDVFKRVIELCVENPERKEKDSNSGSISLEYLPIQYLFGIIKQHKSYVTFMMGNDMMNNEKKNEIFQNIDDVLPSPMSGMVVVIRNGYGTQVMHLL